MQKICLFFVVAAALLRMPVHAQSLGEVEKLAVQGVNEVRKKSGAKPLERIARLDSAAAMQVRWCAETGVLSHTRPSGRFKTVPDRIKHVKYKYSSYGENILFFMPDDDESAQALADQMVQQWVDSPGHYANMRGKQYRHTGFAVAWDEESGRLYACQVFGAEKKAKR